MANEEKNDTTTSSAESKEEETADTKPADESQDTDESTSQEQAEPEQEDASPTSEQEAETEAEQDEEDPTDEEDVEVEAAEAEEAASPEEDEEEDEASSGKSDHEVTIEQLLKAGSHFGHLTSRWHPRMEPYIFMKRNNIHIIDLMQTQVLLDQAADAARRFAKRGRTILFAGTKKQAQQIMRNHAEESDQPHMVNRWLGGTMTNFQTIRRSIRRMDQLEKMEKDGTFDKLKKKERLTRIREREKLESILGGIRTMADLPGALYVVDIKRERIAVNEARKLGIPIIAMVDTNCDPTLVDYPVPANDDALSSIELITSVIAKSIQEGEAQRQAEEQAKKAEKQAKQEA